MPRLITAAVLLATALSLHAQERTPVLLELFTSEGCSSCPPADILLSDIDNRQPVTNADVIVLSEHVDYWNQLGWKDPFSSTLFSERQQYYASLMRSSDVYTPEAIIDGHFAVVGSNRQNVLHAISSAAAKSKAPLDITVARNGQTVNVNVSGAAGGTLWIALAQSRAVSQVANGENAGRTLQHVGVVRLLKKSNGQTSFNVDRNWDGDLRVVGFVQDEQSGNILQVAQKPAP